MSLIFSIISSQAFASGASPISLKPRQPNALQEAFFIVSSEEGSRGRYCARCSFAKEQKAEGQAILLGIHRNNYESRWGAIFAAPEVVKALMRAVAILKDPRVKQVLEFDSGYGFNSAYAVHFNEQYKSYGKPLSWHCFDPKTHEVFGREHPFLKKSCNFSFPYEKTFWQICAQARSFQSSVLALLNFSGTDEECAHIVNAFINKGGKYLALLRVKKDFEKTDLYRGLSWFTAASIEEIKIKESFEGEEASTLFFFTLRTPKDGNDLVYFD